MVSRISPTNSIKGNYPPGTNDQVTLEDDFPFSQVGYVSSLGVGHVRGLVDQPFLQKKMG